VVETANWLTDVLKSYIPTYYKVLDVGCGKSSPADGLNNYRDGTDMWLTDLKLAKGVHNLYDQSFVYKNYAFIGLESSTRGPAIFRHEENDFKNHLDHQIKGVRGKRLIVVSHAPPFGILDRGIRFATEDEETHHIGSTALKNFIEKNLVDLVICGHCHSHGGMVDKFKDTTIVNVSSHDSPGSKGNLAIIELSSDGLVSIDWHDTNEVLDMDSPMRIHGIGPFYCETLDKCGINTIGHLAEVENISALSHSSGISERLLMKFQLKAKSMINDAIYQISPFILPMDNLIFFDIETDTACDRVWLIGILIDGRFIQLYADNWEQERDILEEFIEILKKHPNRTLVSFSGTNFDHRIPLNALRRHSLDADFFESYPHVDLSTLLKRCFIFPNQSFALKELSTYLEYPFKHPDMNGLAVAISYHSHVEDGKPLGTKIFEYNEDDVRAIPHLIEKARSIAGTAKRYY